MPPEKDMQKLRDAKIRQDMLDREASILRAKTQAALAEGISWGMAEDAIEESAEMKSLGKPTKVSLLIDRRKHVAR